MALYYAVLGAGLWAAFRWVPGWAEVFSGGRLQQLQGGVTDFGQMLSSAGSSTVPTEWRSATMAMIGALLVVIPVAWVYVITKRRQGYDPSVVQTMIILPVAVAGIVLIVQSSLPLAFSLAGIVAAVRFRNTLKDTKDAVYVFLAIGVGLSAGAQAFAVTLVMSILFNILVLVLWRFNIGDIYAGQVAALPPDSALATDGEDKPFQGLLKVRANDIDAAAPMLESILEENLKRWKPAGTISTNGDAGTLQYFVRFKKKQPPDKVLALIQQRGIDLELTPEFDALTDQG